ncbi:MAG: isoprenylcysteine carboxylmethyltransferase family protein [Bacteroidales bacterium]
MALLHSFEKSGSFLFRYRGQIPILILIFGLVFLWFSNPIILLYVHTLASPWVYPFVVALSILVSVCGFAIRAYTVGTTPSGTSGRNTTKQMANELNTKGIYSIVRHPLYLGNYLMWAGLLIFTMNLPLFLIISLFYWLYYERIMFTEERYLESQFGDIYLEWSKKVPAFIPNFHLFQKGDIPFSLKTVLRREYTGVLVMVFSFVLMDYFLAFLTNSIMGLAWEWCKPSLFILLFFFVLTMVLRSLKHYTSVLNPEDNRD